jgi:mRNA interferase MazF
MNNRLNTVIVAPITSTHKEYPTRAIFECENVKGSIVIDQIRSVDRQRLIRKLNILDSNTIIYVIKILEEMFKL